MVNIYIQGQLIDQYSDEAIEITSSVLDVGDLTKNSGDFSKTFTVPASSTNNKYFQHWYNASIDDGFDARTKIEGSIDIDGVPFKSGKWRLSEAIFKNGVIDGYVINFFGNLPNIKDTIGDDLLSDMSFADFDHYWTGDSVALGLKGQLRSVFHTQRKLVYTPMSNKRYFYDSSAFKQDVEPSINIANNGAGTGIEWRDLRPSMKAKTIIDRIQHKYGTGTKQVVEIKVASRPTNSGVVTIVLNDVSKSFSITSYATASAAATYISASIATEFSGQVTTSVSSNFITITSVEMEDEQAPLLQIKDAGSLDLEISVDEVGAYAYENPIVFSDDFFQTSEFEQMYLWLNNGDTNNIGRSTVVAPWTSGDLTDIDPVTDVITFNTYRSGSAPNTIRNHYQVKVESQDITNYENIPFTLIAIYTKTDNDGTVTQGGKVKHAVADADGNVPDIELSLTLQTNPGYSSSTFKLQYFIRTNSELEVRLNLTRTEWVKTASDSTPIAQTPITTLSITQDVVTPKVSVSSIMPNIKVVDFLKGIFDMFKLVVVPQDDGSMLINTLDSYYDLGNRHDISEKVDYSTYKVKRGELYQSISYEFEDPSTILNEEFQKRARDGQSYGSSLVNVYESVRPLKLIDGEKVEIKIPFEQVVYDRLIDPSSTSGQSTLNISTGTIADKDLKPVNPKPILHYVSEQDISSCPIKFIGDNNVESTLNDTMLMPMNQFGTLDPTFSLLFESEVSCWDGSTLKSNLYTLHHSDYIEAVFRLKRRSFEYEALLPTSLITRLELNDILSVKGIDYRINKFKHNLLTGITKLDLINGFDRIVGTSLTANQYTPAFYIPSSVNMNKHSFTLYFNVPRAESDYTIAIVDTGDGTVWLTSAHYGSNDNMMFIRTGSDNPSESSRSCNLVYTNTVTGEVNTVIVTQLSDE